MKKIGIVITDGVGFRNFILGDFISEAEKRFDQIVILSCLPASVYPEFSLKTKIIELTVFEEKFPTWFFRKSKEVAHLQSHKNGNSGIQDSLQMNKTTSRSPRGIATRLIFGFTSFLNSEKWIRNYEKWQGLSFSRNSVTIDYRKLLKEERFDILFFTHQRPPFIAPLAFEAKALKVKTVSFIFSWDNLASKGRMAADFDLFLVWSLLMKNDLLHYYPKIKSESIKIVGTPQFEPYVLDRYRMSKEEFEAKFNIDKTLKTVCFSCGDVSTSKNDGLYITEIAQAQREGKIPKINFIVRTSPAETAERFKEIMIEYPEIRWNFPKWILSRQGHQESWSQRVPTEEDVSDLRALLEYSSLNVNMLSTMSLDFMQFDKPVINVAFGNTANGLYDDQRFLNYVHLINVVNSKATKIALNSEQLITFINEYLVNPNIDRENRRKLLDLQVGVPLDGTSERIASTLMQWS